MALCGELFHSTTGVAFADILVNGHRETCPIRSKRVRGWLRRRYCEATGAAAQRRGDPPGGLFHPGQERFDLLETYCGGQR
jgi:hypothetical protein